MDGEAVMDAVETVEAPAPEFSGTEAPEPTTETPIIGGEREAPEAPAPGDEKIPDEKIRAAIKLLRDNGLSKEADELRKGHFAQAQWTEAFPTPREAKQAKLAWDSVGGEVGFAELREKEQWIKTVDAAAESGDPSLIEDWAKEFPGGFRQVMPHALKQYAQMDQEGFTKAIAPHFSGLLDRVQLGDRLQQAYFAFKGGNTEYGQSILSSIFDWVDAYRKWADQGKAQATNPQEEKLAQREKDLAAKEENQFRDDVGRQIWRYQQESVLKALQPYLKRAKLSDGAKTRLVDTIHRDLNQNMKANDGLQRQVQAFLAKKDGQGTINYMQGQIDNISAEIVRRVYQDLYGGAPKAPAPAPAAPAASPNGQKPAIGAAIKIPQKPAMSEIQKGPDYMAAYIRGKAIMATGPLKGKLVAWR